MRIIRYFFSQEITLINECYNNEKIMSRIQAFRNMPLDMPQFQQSILSLTVPSFLKLTTAKPLQQFHAKNQTPVNCSILHALAFIQFNAFQAYSDTMLRFAFSSSHRNFWKNINKDIYQQFVTQIRKIAIEEGEHCTLLIQRLEKLGCRFGDYPVITNLTTTISKTTSHPLQRFAMVSVVHQGRGMKSIDKLAKKMLHVKDKQSSNLLRIIQKQEMKHFQIGLKWFNFFIKNKVEEQAKNGNRIEVSQILQELNNKFKTKVKLQDLHQHQNI